MRLAGVPAGQMPQRVGKLDHQRRQSINRLVEGELGDWGGVVRCTVVRLFRRLEPFELLCQFRRGSPKMGVIGSA